MDIERYKRLATSKVKAGRATKAVRDTLKDVEYSKQDWPVASELVPGGMHFHSVYNAHDMIIRSDKRSNGRISGKKLWVGFRNSWVEVK